jgi:hypothetical protein
VNRTVSITLPTQRASLRYCRAATLRRYCGALLTAEPPTSRFELVAFPPVADYG